MNTLELAGNMEAEKMISFRILAAIFLAERGKACP